MNLLRQHSFQAALLKEFEAKALVKMAADDLGRGMPKGAQQWAQSIRTATGGGSGPRSWLFILPNNHSVAGIYPLTVAAKAGLRVWVRRTNSKRGSAESLLIAHFKKEMGARLTIVPETFRIGETLLPPGVEAVFAFAADTTVAALRPALRIPLQAFGEATCAALIATDDIAANPSAIARLLVRDAFSLGQMGCMSTRVAIVTGTPTSAMREAFVRLVRAEAYRVVKGQLTITTEVALDHDIPVWLGRNARILPRTATDEPLVPWTDGPPIHASAALSARRFVIPIIFTNEISEVREWLPTLRYLAASPAWVREEKVFPGVQIVPLGRANAPQWDGTHEGRPLFVPNVLSPLA